MKISDVQTELTEKQEVILPVLSIHTAITGILNSALKYVEIQSKRKVQK